ncbi:MAG: hypothetical protein H7Y11_14470 [Armatimonadetes bacterium]|nr:hypothetical protein [Anaerolineae bacterium]
MVSNPHQSKKYSVRASHALDLARQCALQYHSDLLRPAHLLAGLLAEPDGVAGRVLRALGLEDAQLGALLSTLPRSTHTQPDPAYAPDLLHVLGLAATESDQMEHEYIGTEHLLLGLTDLPAVSDVLGALNLDGNSVRQQVVLVFKGATAQLRPVQPDDDDLLPK